MYRTLNVKNNCSQKLRWQQKSEKIRFKMRNFVTICIILIYIGAHFSERF